MCEISFVNDEIRRFYVVFHPIEVSERILSAVFFRVTHQAYISVILMSNKRSAVCSFSIVYVDVYGGMSRQSPLSPVFCSGYG
jgi:hypothetical protein